MALLIVVLVLVALVVAASIASWRGRVVSSAAGRPVSEPVPPTFRVVALGVAGSGKTVYLASMFQRLQVQAPGGSYFLESDAAQRVALGSVFRQVANPEQPWPAGT